ncbi:hypothetical protein M413DRAFT_30349 [Hebeloma cylindrosporum]|uniref:Deoxyribonuclease NucA/NucB domain-containing protein n=1 Tax=Hebeloma cylindrosporum TaxID=76867 RepID=A0A0C3C3S2_HEBCY|nr:hypothetical protein M413DRAFT_30349 [Hebeloma cylindrosporum h7]
MELGIKQSNPESMNLLLWTTLSTILGGFIHIVACSPTISTNDSPTSSDEIDTTDIINQPDSTFANLTQQAAYNYEIDCNTCVPLSIASPAKLTIFIVQLPKFLGAKIFIPHEGKAGAWGIHVERTPASRGQSECAGYNRCSSGRASGPPPGGWAVNPNTNWSCDEQPKSSAHEGGAGSATRCMPAKENSAEGSNWGSFINGNTAATKNTRLADGTAVDVVLKNAKKTGYCASLTGGKTACGSAASPPGTNDGPRQR